MTLHCDGVLEMNQVARCRWAVYGFPLPACLPQPSYGRIDIGVLNAARVAVEGQRGYVKRGQLWKHLEFSGELDLIAVRGARTDHRGKRRPLIRLPYGLPQRDRYCFRQRLTSCLRAECLFEHALRNAARTKASDMSRRADGQNACARLQLNTLC